MNFNLHIHPTGLVFVVIVGSFSFDKNTGQAVLLGIRPENLALAAEMQPNCLHAQVLVVEPLGSHKLLTMQVGASLAKVSVPPDQLVSPMDEVWLHFDPEKIRWMDADSGEAIRG